MDKYAWHKSNFRELKTLLEITFTGYPNNSLTKTEAQLNFLSHESTKYLNVSVLGAIYCPKRTTNGLE